MDDVRQLALKEGARLADLDMPMALLQIAGWQTRLAGSCLRGLRREEACLSASSEYGTVLVGSGGT